MMPVSSAVAYFAVFVLIVLSSWTSAFRSSSWRTSTCATRVFRRTLSNDDGNLADSGKNVSLSFLAPQQIPNIEQFDTEGTISRGFIPTGPTDLANVEGGSSGSTAIRKTRSPGAQKYFSIVEKLAPNEMLQKFAQTAPSNVQAAAKSTIMTILGSLPNYALDATMLTTSSKLANLLYQMQMTGYMLKNAEYRMTLTRSLKGLPRLPAPAVVIQGNISFSPSPQDGTSSVTGEVTVQTTSGDTVSVDVNELTSALSKEVAALRSELAMIRNEREQELRSNLLTYIQALPENDLAKLTSDMSPEVLDSINMLVDALMERLGIDTTGPEMVLKQNVGAMAQLCMWQMVVGYKLRELEALEKGVSLD